AVGQIRLIPNAPRIHLAVPMPAVVSSNSLPNVLAELANLVYCDVGSAATLVDMNPLDVIQQHAENLLSLLVCAVHVSVETFKFPLIVGGLDSVPTKIALHPNSSQFVEQLVLLIGVAGI